jgi:hypothetical protein
MLAAFTHLICGIWAAAVQQQHQQQQQQQQQRASPCG